METNREVGDFGEMRPLFHISGKKGWLNDPNGLVVFRGEYHVFYQADPLHLDNRSIRWAHVKSRDMVTWERCPDALLPDREYDRDGCFTGSAIEKDGKLWLIYTGHRNCPEGYEETQNVAWSEDGIHFVKYEGNPVIDTPPADTTMRFRDPKVWEKDGVYYLIVGAENENRCGKAVLYSSRDLLRYTYRGVVAESRGDLGNMWECPNLTDVGGRDVLIFSPKGLKTGHGFQHGFESGYLTGKMDYNRLEYRCEDIYRKLDAGFDFYAPQVMEAGERRILLAWMAVPDTSGEEAAQGWRHMLTIPRELFLLQDGRIGMRPVKEMEKLRRKELESGLLDTGRQWMMPAASMELTADAKAREYRLEIGDDEGVLIRMIREKKGWTFLRRRADGWEKRIWNAGETGDSQIRLYVDRTSLELFADGGATVFSCRFYPRGSLWLRILKEENTPSLIQGYAMGKIFAE